MKKAPRHIQKQSYRFVIEFVKLPIASKLYGKVREHIQKVIFFVNLNNFT